MEKIEVKDFVGIKEMSIDIKQINIFIGPQASGKSIIAKLLYYFKDLIFEIINAAEESHSILDLNKSCKQKFQEYFPSSSWGNKYFVIRYYIDEEFIEISRKKSRTRQKTSEIVFKYSDFYKKSLPI